MVCYSSFVLALFFAHVSQGEAGDSTVPVPVKAPVPVTFPVAVPAPVKAAAPTPVSPVSANTLATIDVINHCTNNVIVQAEDQQSFFSGQQASAFELLPTASRRFVLDREVAGARLSAKSEGNIVGTTKVEFTLLNSRLMYYDVSLVDGYTYSMAMYPNNVVADGYKCGSANCVPQGPVESWCPPETLRKPTVPNDPLACLNLHVAINDPVTKNNFPSSYIQDLDTKSHIGCDCMGNGDCASEENLRYGNSIAEGRTGYCCSPYGPFGNRPEFVCRDEDKPKPFNAFGGGKSYAEIFKEQCPGAYSWQFDDFASTFTCEAAAYTIEFCPITDTVTSTPQTLPPSTLVTTIPTGTNTQLSSSQSDEPSFFATTAPTNTITQNSSPPSPAPVDFTTAPVPANTLATIDVINHCTNNVIVQAEDQQSFFSGQQASTFELLPTASRRFVLDREVAGARLSAKSEGNIVGTTKVEFTLLNSRLMYYDVSLVDGYTYSMAMYPNNVIADGYKCGSANCVPQGPVESWCPPETLRKPTVPNDPLACLNLHVAINDPVTKNNFPSSYIQDLDTKSHIGCDCMGNGDCASEENLRYGNSIAEGRTGYCCSPYGPFGNRPEFVCRDEDKPKPFNAFGGGKSYAEIFKEQCPGAYSWQFDDFASTFTCEATAYTIEFCPP